MASHAEYRLNTRFLGRLLLIVVVVAVGLFFIHRYQERSLIDRFLTQADQARDQREPRRELDYLRTFIALKPTDNAARVRYGQVLAKHQRSPLEIIEAYFALQKALQTDPNLPTEVRMECVKLALRPEINQPSEARRELENLLRIAPENAEYQTTYAEALMRLGDFGPADQFLTRVIGTHKNRIDAYAMLAWIRKEKIKTSSGAGEVIIQQMLDNNPEDARAWLHAAAFFKQYQQTSQYDDAIAKARKLAPSDPDVLYAAADRLLTNWKAKIPLGGQPKSTPEFEEAITLLQESVAQLGTLPAVEPLPETGTPERRKLETAAVAYRNLAQSLTLIERYDQAEKFARMLADKFPSYMIWMKAELLDVLVRQQKYDEAKAICLEMERRGYSPAIVELQRGIMAAQQKQWVDATRHLERTVTEVAQFPDLRMRASLMLSLCLKETNELDRLLVAIRDSVPANVLDPNWAAIKVMLAEIHTQLGRNQEAITIYKEVAEKQPRVISQLVRALIAERATQTVAGANDAEIENYLKRLPDSEEKAVLVSQFLMAKKDSTVARAELDRALEKNPSAPGLHVARFQMEIFEKRFDAAKEILSKAEAKLGDTFEVRQMKLTLLMAQHRADPKTPIALEPLATGLDKFKPEQRFYLLKMLAIAARNTNRRDLARQWIGQLEKERGDHDMELQYQLFDLALLDGDEAEIQRVLTKIETISGGKDNPSYRLASAFALIYKADKLTDQIERSRLLHQATEVLNGLEQTRKEWGRLYLAQAKVADMLGKRDIAMDKYRIAVEKGERSPEIVGRLFDLYYSARRTEAWASLVKQFPELANNLEGGGGEERQVFALVDAGDYPRAIELGRKLWPEDSTDPVKLKRLASLYRACKDLIKAEATLRKALNVKPEDTETIAHLVQVMTENARKEDAKQLIQLSKDKFKTDDELLLLAQAYAQVEDRESCRAILVKSLEKRPNALPVLKLAGSFYFKGGELKDAAPIMEKVIQHPNASPNDLDLAKRVLALCTIVSGDHASGIRALKILGFGTPDHAAAVTGSESIDDLRCRFAVVAVIRGKAARIASITLLREIEKKQKTLSIDEQLAYGKIEYALDHWPEAQRRFQMAANSPDGGPAAIAIYANALLRKNDLENAKIQIDRLMAKEPNHLRTVELAARLAVLDNKQAEAANLLRKYSETKDAKPEVVAAILGQLGLNADAEPYYRRAADADSTQKTRLLLAHFLARTGRAEDAIEEFKKAWNAVPPELSVPMLCEAMFYASSSTTPSVIAKAGDMIRAEVAKKPGLKPYLAAFLSLTEQVPEAITLSRQILETEKTNIFTMNNLAFFLALKEGKYNDAFDVIKKAIEIVGPDPVLLDTEAVVLIAAGRPNDAVEKLKEVIVDAPSAVSYMHMAQAYLALSQRAEAMHAIREAKRLNMRLDEFHPLERNSIRAVLAQLGG